MKHLTSYLIDSNVFLDHYLSKQLIDDIVYYEHKFDDLFVNKYDAYNIDIRPYIFILDLCNEAEKKIVYMYFRNHMKMLSKLDADIHSYKDINDITTMLCFIYFIQYYFL